MTPDATVVVLSNREYDVYSTLLLEAELCRLRSGNGVVDCRNVRYLDSTALAAFVRALKRLRTHDGNCKIVLMNTNPLLRQAFAITHLDELFEFA